jgi:hypothetical protein
MYKIKEEKDKKSKSRNNNKPGDIIEIINNKEIKVINNSKLASL